LSSRRRHTRFSRDWSSDVCSSDLTGKAYLSERGTSDPDDPIMEIPVHALGQMALGDQYVAAQRADALGDERLQAQRASLASTADDQLRRAGADAPALNRLEAELAEAEGEVARLGRMMGPASLTGRLGNSTAGRYVQGGLAAAQERVAQAQQRLAQANAEREQSTGQAEQQLGDFQQRERSARLSLGDAGYLAGVAAEPAARAKRAEQATKFRGDLAKSVANAVHINKDDQEAISKADLMAAINALDPAILDMAAERGDAQGAVMRAAQDMVRFGMNG